MKKMNTRFSWNLMFAVLTVLLSPACDGEDEPIPAYIQINGFEVIANNPAYHGSVSHKITNAAVFLTNKTTLETHSLGLLSLPVKVPSIVTGEVDITIDPVIKSNGNSFFTEIYPFYERFTTSITLEPSQEISINPTTSYIPDAKFRLLEDFEGNGHQFSTDRDDNPDTFIAFTQDDVFEGGQSGKVTLDTANNVFVVASNQVYDIDVSEATKVFMEVNYKTDVPLEFGVLAIDQLGNETPNFEFGVFARDEWNKIYFNMTNLLATSNEDEFVLIIRGGIPIENGQYTLNEAHIYFDNIKLVHF